MTHFVLVAMKVRRRLSLETNGSLDTASSLKSAANPPETSNGTDEKLEVAPFGYVAVPSRKDVPDLSFDKM
jgi:hypothetical protein